MIAIDTVRKKVNKQANSKTDNSASAKMSSPEEGEEGNMDTDPTDPKGENDNPAAPAGIERYFQIVSRKRKREQLNAEDADDKAKTTSRDTSATRATTANNRYAILKDESDEAPKPPPIYVRVQNNNELVKGIKSLIKKDLFYIVEIKRGLIKETKIQTQREVDYCQIVNWLDAKQLQFYTYQIKSEKGLRVVIKGIDHSVPTEDIKQELNDLGFEVKYVYNILNRFKQPQPMFKVELMPESSKAPKGKIHPIYEVRYILNRKIVVEEPFKRKTPIQCKNCQEFGHTKTYCKLKNVCVACGGGHQTSECNKRKENSSDKKCSNCCGNHTANYKGCPVYMAILSNQKQQKASSKPSLNTGIHNPQANPTSIIIPPTATAQTSMSRHPNYDRQNFTYANIVKNNGHQPTSNQNEGMMQILITLTNNINQLTQTMQQMQTMLNRQTEILSKLIK